MFASSHSCDRVGALEQTLVSISPTFLDLKNSRIGDIFGLVLVSEESDLMFL